MPLKVTLVSVGLLSVVVNPAAVYEAELPLKITLVSVGLPLALIHPAAGAYRAAAIRIAAADGEAIEHGRVIRPAAGDDVVAVLAVVGEVRAVVAGEIAAEDGAVGRRVRVALGARRLGAGKAAVKGHPVFSGKVALRGSASPVVPGL